MDISAYDTEEHLITKKASFNELRAWIRAERGLCVSNLNISQAKNLLGFAITEYKGKQASGKYEQPKLKEDKLVAIKEAFDHFGILKDEE